MKYARPVIAVLTAASLWFLMFSPWTSGIMNFWIEISCAATILTVEALLFSGDSLSSFLSMERPLMQLALGVAIAFALWGVFFVGDKLSSLLFDFARPQVNSVYAMKTGLPTWLIGLLLLFVIGPAEEFFWRGYVQRKFQELFASDGNGQSAPIAAFVFTTVVYAMIHVWSFNFMLVMAALVAGCVWGFIYMKSPRFLPALIISHALWDALVFVILPI